MKTKITISLTIALWAISLNIAKATTYTIQVANYSFTPASVDILSGDTVIWVWSAGSHTTTSVLIPAGATSWSSPINSVVTQFQLQLTIPGTYNYISSLDAGVMKGVINVSIPTGVADYHKNTYTVKTYPNPFNNYINISFTLSEKTRTRINVFDVSGQVVKTLTDTDYDIGSYTVTWDGKNDSGVSVNKGIYFYMIESNNHTVASGKIMFGS